MADGFEPLKSDEDVEEILRLAVRSGGLDGSTLRDRLQASAAELGVSPEALQAAESQWLAKRQTEREKEIEVEERKQFKKIRIGDFVSHLGSYLAVNAFLFWLDVRDGSLTWFYWPLFGWGIAIVIHLFGLFAHDAEAERDFQKWRVKKDRIRRRHGVIVEVGHRHRPESNDED